MTACIRSTVPERPKACLGLCPASNYTGGVVWRKRDEQHPPKYMETCLDCGIVAQVIAIATPTTEHRRASDEGAASDWAEPAVFADDDTTRRGAP